MRMYDLPDARGHFGPYGGRYVSETLMPALLELERAYHRLSKEARFRRDLRVQVRGSKRVRLVHADVIVGRRRVERLLTIPTARHKRCWNSTIGTTTGRTSTSTPRRSAYRWERWSRWMRSGSSTTKC